MGMVAEVKRGDEPLTPVPDYLDETYWWAYVHPNAVRFFERQWLVNLILWGNFRRLRDAALNALGPKLEGRTLQVACVYGDFTPRLADRLSTGAALDVIDVLPVQLANLRRKLPDRPMVRLLQRDSSALGLADAQYDQVVLFFLLHEQPAEVRARTVSEALRVVKPGGRVVLVDYHRPAAWHPLRPLMWLILRTLEPFALDLWRQELVTLLPAEVQPKQYTMQTFWGGLYQLVTIER